MRLTDEQRQMVEDNVGLAYYMVNKYMKNNYDLVDRKGLTLEDLNQVALELLCLNVQKYNPEKSKLSTYACAGMYFKINQFVKTYNSIKIPRWDHWGSNSLKDKVYELNNIMQGYVTSLNEPLPISKNENTFYEDSLGEEDTNIDQIELDDLLRRNLNERELKILKLKLQGRTQIEIAKTVGISQGHVSRVLIETREKLAKELIA